MNPDEIVLKCTKIINAPINLPLEIKRQIMALLVPYAEIERAYLVNKLHMLTGTECYGLGLEFVGGPRIKLAPEWRDRLLMMRKNISRIMGRKKLDAIYILNNIDLFIGPNGIERFLKLAECIYQKGGQDKNGNKRYWEVC